MPADPSQPGRRRAGAERRPPRQSFALSRLDRYILGQLVLGLLAVTCGLVALIWMTQSLRFVELIVDRGLSLWAFIKLTGLLVPSFVAIILPVAVFVVVLFAYQRLAADREITVMRASGVSNWGLARPALLLALGALVLGFVLNLWVVPAAFGAFREDQFAIRNRVAAFLLQEGVFTQVTDKLTIYVARRDPNGTLHGLLIDDERDADSPVTVLAESGRFLGTGATPTVLLYNGSREQVDPKTGALAVVSFKRNAIALAENAGPNSPRFRDPTDMSLGELLNPPPGSVRARDIGKLVAEAYRRLTSPFTSLSYALLALLAILGGRFRRHGGGMRVFVAVLIETGLVALGLAAHNLAARNVALVWLMWVHALLPGLVCGWLLFARQREPVPRGVASPSGVPA
ncbi:MAG: LPS export ABC transporter permease LptF [Rhodospirillales bacterium]|nr:LPS export ABC transporter permease LptF [Rhodospirillales bacterium]